MDLNFKGNILNCSYKCTGQEIFCTLYFFQGQEFEKEILPCSQILYFDVSDETMTERLLGRGKTSGRADDNIDTIKLRLDTFHKHSKPVVEAYKAKCCTVSISFLNELLPIYNVELLLLQDCNILCLFCQVPATLSAPARGCLAIINIPKGPTIACSLPPCLPGDCLVKNKIL